MEYSVRGEILRGENERARSPRLWTNGFAVVLQVKAGEPFTFGLAINLAEVEIIRDFYFATFI